MKNLLFLLFLWLIGFGAFAQKDNADDKNQEKNKKSDQDTRYQEGASGVKRSISYKFNNLPADEDPGEGIFRYNKDTVSGVTYIFVDVNDQSGEDQTKWYSTWDDTTGATGRGRINLVEYEGKNVNVFDVTGVFVRGAGYWKIPVRYVSGSLPADGVTYYYIFERIENKDKAAKTDQETSAAVVAEPTPEPVAQITQPEPVIEAKEEPVIQPEPVVEVKEEPVSQPEPVVEVKEEPVIQPEPVVEVKEEPVSQPEPVVEVKEEPVIQPEPVVEVKEEPVTQPEPVVEVKEEPVTQPEPVVEVKEEPVIQPEPVVEVKEEPVSQPEPVVEVKIEPVVQPEPVVEVKAEPVVQPEPVAEVKEEPVVQPEPVTEVKSVPVVPQEPVKEEIKVEEVVAVGVVGNVAVASQPEQPKAEPRVRTTEPARPAPKPKPAEPAQPKATTQTTQPQQTAPVKKETPASQSAPKTNLPSQQTQAAQPARPAPVTRIPSTGSAGTGYSIAKRTDGSRIWHGIIETGYGLKASDYGLNNYRINFISSFSLGQHFMIGLGLGYRRYFDKPEKHADWYMVSARNQVPVFLDLRVLFSKKKLTPFLALGLGSSTEKSKADTTSYGSFINPSAGIWYRLSKNTALFADIAYEMMDLEYALHADNIPYRRKNNSVSLNIGIRF